MRGSALKLAAGAAALVGLAALAAPAASASQTFGADLTQLAAFPNCGSAAGEQCSMVTIVKSTAVPETGSPITGVLVSARVRTIGDAATINVRVLRPGVAANSFFNIGPEIPIPVTADVNPGGHVTGVTGLHHPIAMGQVLGVGWTQTAGGTQVADISGTATCWFRQGAAQDGHSADTERVYNTAGCGNEVLVQGTVEPDADGDGFGDETQDGCLGVSAHFSGCPLPIPCGGFVFSARATARCFPPLPDNVVKRCKKKKKRSAEPAKKKRCKRKRQK
jgi:hypothetical protein